MTDQASRPPVSRPYEPLQIRDPEDAHQIYDELRKCPVAHTSAGGDLYWLTRYADVRAAALDSDRFSSAAKGVFFPPRGAFRASVLEMDPPEHSAWRRLYQEAMTASRLKAVEPQLVAATNSLIDTFSAAGECELIEDFAGPLPVLGVCALIGVSGLAVDEIRDTSRRFAEEPENRAEVMQTLGGLLLAQVLERRNDPRGDYLTYLAQAQPNGRPMDEYEIAMVAAGFLTAGHESTTSALSSLLAHVLARPELKAVLLADDALLSRSIEEAIRLHPPFHGFHRTTTASVEVGGVEIPPDATVRLCWASANRDPSVFDRPEEFDPQRRPNSHVGFGFGRHVCVGAPLAKLEMRIAVRELLRRLPDIRLKDGDVEWHMPDSILERPKAYRAQFTPASPGA